MCKIFCIYDELSLKAHALLSNYYSMKTTISIVDTSS